MDSFRGHMAWNYSDKTVDLFLNALMGDANSFMGIIPDADAIGMHGSLECGDAIKFYLKIEQGSNPSLDRIYQARYQTFGCTSAIAASEALCAILEDSRPTPLAALGITTEDIVRYLGGMPEQKIHCSVMGAEVLKNAIIDWANRRKVSLKEIVLHDKNSENAGQLCNCLRTSKDQLLSVIVAEGLTTVEEIKKWQLAGSGCGKCLPEIETILKSDLSKIWRPVTELTNDQKMIIYETMQELLPGIISKKNCQAELLAIKGNRVYCQFRPIEAKQFVDLERLKNTVEKFLQEKVGSSIVLIDVGP